MIQSPTALFLNIDLPTLLKTKKFNGLQLVIIIIFNIWFPMLALIKQIKECRDRVFCCHMPWLLPPLHPHLWSNNLLVFQTTNSPHNAFIMDCKQSNFYKSEVETHADKEIWNHSLIHKQASFSFHLANSLTRIYLVQGYSRNPTCPRWDRTQSKLNYTAMPVPKPSI